MRDIKFRVRVIEKDNKSRMHYCDLYNFDSINSEESLFEVMQYTGLKGNNGVLVYEGDIVRSIRKDNIVGVVKIGKHEDSDIENDTYTNLRHGVYIQTIQGRKQCPYGFGGEVWFDVIGNIYENPELLETD